jgi:hypothetical protein
MAGRRTWMNFIASVIDTLGPRYVFHCKALFRVTGSHGRFEMTISLNMHTTETSSENRNLSIMYQGGKPFFFNLYGGTWRTAATTGLLYQPQMIGEGEWGEIGGMKIGRGNRSTLRKPAPAPLCPPQIPHD